MTDARENRVQVDTPVIVTITAPTEEACQSVLDDFLAAYRYKGGYPLITISTGKVDLSGA